MIRYISLAEYVWLAEQVTGLDAAVLAKAARIDLADSGLPVRRLRFVFWEARCANPMTSQLPRWALPRREP
ncbi:MAG: hypothetical protein M0004_10430 [Actinomycetota bacterium]|nr:hypothetical protein [Actinomycetota bacterium]